MSVTLCQCLAGARGIEPRSTVLETVVLAVVLCPYICSHEFRLIKIVTDWGTFTEIAIGALTNSLLSGIQYMDMSAAKIVPNKPFMILLYGYPGAGKTAFARQLAAEVNAAHLQQDRLSIELYGNNDESTDKHARNAMNFMTREFLRAGVSVVFDANVHRLAERRALRDEARKSKITPILIWLQVDPETAYQRGSKRDHRKTDDQYAREYTPDSYEAVLRRMQNPENEDYVVISGKHTFQTQRSAVYRKFYELGILTPSQLSQNIAKPELMNLIPQKLGGRADITRRNINIR